MLLIQSLNGHLLDPYTMSYFHMWSYRVEENLLSSTKTRPQPSDKTPEPSTKSMQMAS